MLFSLSLYPSLSIYLSTTFITPTHFYISSFLHYFILAFISFHSFTSFHLIILLHLLIFYQPISISTSFHYFLSILPSSSLLYPSTDSHLFTTFVIHFSFSAIPPNFSFFPSSVYFTILVFLDFFHLFTPFHPSLHLFTPFHPSLHLFTPFHPSLHPFSSIPPSFHPFLSIPSSLFIHPSISSPFLIHPSITSHPSCADLSRDDGVFDAENLLKVVQIGQYGH